MFDGGRERERSAFIYFGRSLGRGILQTGRSLPSDARLGGQTFFGFRQQNMACYPRAFRLEWERPGLCWAPARPTAGILQVSTFQLEASRPIMGGKRKRNRFTSAWECVYRLLLILTLQTALVVFSSHSVCLHALRLPGL